MEGAKGQVFLTPPLLIISGLFCYAFIALGAFAVEAWRRRWLLGSLHELERREQRA